MWAKIGTITVIWIIHGLGITFYQLIKSYQDSKPLGYQTLLGKLIASLFMNVLTQMAVYHGIVVSVVIAFGPVEEWDHYKIIMGIHAFLSSVTILQSQTAFLVVMVTKYLSIYHSTFVYSLNEEKTVKGLQVATFLLTVTLTLFEFGYVTRMEDTVMYQIMLDVPTTEDAKVEKVKLLVSFMALMVAAIMQARLEFDKHQKWCFCFTFGAICQSSASVSDGFIDNVVVYKPLVLRAAWTLAVSAFTLATYQTLIGTKIALGTGMSAVFTIFYILIPLIFIYNHPNLKNYCLSKLAPSHLLTPIIEVLI